MEIENDKLVCRYHTTFDFPITNFLPQTIDEKLVIISFR
jgi:hypothetical protein